MTQRVIALVKDPRVLPTGVLTLTFTRAAAQELRSRVRAAIGEEVPPQVSTLHSFALRQLLMNAAILATLPQPLRIADDWEEKEVIIPDLQALLGVDKKQIECWLNRLSADWETLRAEEEGWEAGFPEPRFIGAWQWHRELYGYTLRSELVYQLKRALEQQGGFQLESQFRHVIVDEYQDLNPCDIAIIEHMRAHGAELYVAGDDDQSIYGFRHAHPLAIRNFVTDIDNAADLRLEVCHRCDPAILQLGQFIIEQEVGREQKQLIPEDGRPAGVVALRRYSDQFHEATGIAAACTALVNEGTPHGQILILLRGDRRKVFSSVLAEALARCGLPVHTDVGGPGPLDTPGGRILLSLMRLAAEPNDSLAWRALLMLDRNNLGVGAARAVERAAGTRFADGLLSNVGGDALGSFSSRARVWTQEAQAEASGLRARFDMSAVNPDLRREEFLGRLRGLERSERVQSEEEFGRALEELVRAGESSDADDLVTLVRSIGATREDEEQVVVPDAINILSMHKAKGLGADVVFIAAAEDEYIPGRANSERERAEERRLLYVSITRARHKLFISYCDNRKDRQAHTGSTSGSTQRHLTRFLRDGPLRPTGG